MTEPAPDSPAKRRLDLLLVERGLSPSRARAQAEIKAGRVRVAGRPIAKPAQEVPRDAAITLEEPAIPYVSRGGLKLAHALDHFGIDPNGKVALDLGASTGGFTDVLLRRGAAKVYAVDVGHGQLALEIAKNPRVVSLEKTNARELSAAQIPEAVDVITCDVSFISLKLALPPALALAAPGAWLVALIKPQFEAGKGRVGKGGVVRDEAVHAEVCADIENWLGARGGWRVIGIEPSPILGPDGNREFLLVAKKSENTHD